MCVAQTAKRRRRQMKLDPRYRKPDAAASERRQAKAATKAQARPGQPKK